MKFYIGKVALGYSQKEVCLVINKEQEHAINTKHLRDELCIKFGKKDGWLPETIDKA